MLEHSGDEDDRQTSRKSSPTSHHFFTSTRHKSTSHDFPPAPPLSLLLSSHSIVAITHFFLNLCTGFLHPSIFSSILSSIQPTYIFTHPPWQIIPTSVLSHLRRRPALPLFILTTIPAHLLSRPVAKHPTLTSSSFLTRTPSHPTAVPRSSSNLENTEKKRVKTRLKKLIMKRPPLQALQEKGLIKGEKCCQCCPLHVLVCHGDGGGGCFLPLDVSFTET